MSMIDGGASDVEFADDMITVTTAMEDFGNIQKKLNEIEIVPKEAGLQRLPLTTKEISKETFQVISKLIDILEEDDDVQRVYHNVEFNESLLED